MSSGAIVGGGLLVWSLGNWLFFVLAGRLLGPRDYGLVAAILSGCLVVFVLCSGLQPAIAASNRGNAPDAIYARALRIVVRMTLIAMGITGALVVIAGLTIGGFPTGIMLIAVTVLTGMAVFPLTQGQLQGSGNFLGFGLGFTAVGIARPVVLVLLWGGGLHVVAALLGTAASWIIGAIVAGLFAARAIRTSPIAEDAPEWVAFRRALLPNALGATAIAVLTNVDVITAKLVLPSTPAGVFAAAAAIAQGLFLVPQVFVTLVVPRLAARRAAQTSSAHIALLGVLGTLLLGGVFIAVMIPCGRLLMRLTYGSQFAAAGDLLPYYGLAMAIMGCAIVLLYHQITRRDFRYSWILLGIAVGQIVALAAIARSAYAIITIDLICALGALVAHELLAKTAGERLIDGFSREHRS